MKRTLEKLKKQKPTVIVVIGDSCSVDCHWTLGRKNWVGYLTEALWHTYGDGFITVINSSKCGSSYSSELKRLETSVLRFRPDLVVSAIGGLKKDENPGRKDPFSADRQAARQVVRRIQAIGGEILFITYNPVVYGYWKPLPFGANPGEAFPESPMHSEASAKALVALARELRLPVVDLYSAWKRHKIPYRFQTSHPQNLWLWMADIVHPGPVGHLAFFRTIAPVFKVSPYFPWEHTPLLKYPQEKKKS
ncbi:MAG: SGNH/GDSL hydrolase family protein [Candidatus Omnitrophica bacterium]|nr:SGNH/GDSL hydrolase family protein [Candidatus Omnitrophota bacterium]